MQKFPSLPQYFPKAINIITYPNILQRILMYINEFFIQTIFMKYNMCITHFCLSYLL